MKKVDKFAGTTFKVMIVLYVLVIAFQAAFRPDVYRIVSVLVEGCVGILLVYIPGSWALTKLGYFQGGSIEVNRKALIKTLCAVAALILLCVGTECFFHNSSLTQQAVEDLQASKDGKDALGVPIRIGWFITGGVHIKGGDGAANLSIPVKGSKAAAELDVKGIKKDGEWHIVDLNLIAAGNKTVVRVPH
jgi:hypothetical protein